MRRRCPRRGRRCLRGQHLERNVCPHRRQQRCQTTINLDAQPVRSWMHPRRQQPRWNRRRAFEWWPMDR